MYAGQFLDFYLDPDYKTKLLKIYNTYSKLDDYEIIKPQNIKKEAELLMEVSFEEIYKNLYDKTNFDPHDISTGRSVLIRLLNNNSHLDLTSYNYIFIEYDRLRKFKINEKILEFGSSYDTDCSYSYALSERNVYLFNGLDIQVIDIEEFYKFHLYFFNNYYEKITQDVISIESRDKFIEEYIKKLKEDDSDDEQSYDFNYTRYSEFLDLISDNLNGYDDHYLWNICPTSMIDRIPIEDVTINISYEKNYEIHSGKFEEITYS